MTNPGTWTPPTGRKLPTPLPERAMTMFLPSLIRLCGFYPIRKLLGWRLRRHLAAFHRATEQPRKVQDELLFRIIRAQQGTAFGHDHGFRAIANRDDFRRHVPILRYEDHEPYIKRCRQGDFNALVAEPTVHMFAMTSGTTASRKYIPVTSQYLADYKRSWSLWGLRVWQNHPEVRLRPITQLSANWDEFRTEAGIPCGALTGLTVRNQTLVARLLYTVPWQAACIHDPHAKYYAILRFSIPRKVGMLIAANPSTLINLARTGDKEKENLLRDIHNGTLTSQLKLPEDVRAALTEKLAPMPERARELARLAERSGTLYPRDYWGPSKFLVGTWTGGSMAAYLRDFPRYFGDAPIRDIGLIASEGRMTIPFADGTPSGVLDIGTHYFEFVPEPEIDREKPTVLSADEVEVGKRYFILLTTAYGLYRYNIFDLVQVTGFYNGTPLVEFLNKGSHFSNITGEKLSEHQVTKAMTELYHDLDLHLAAYSVAPCWDDEQPYYGLFIESTDLAGEGQGRHLAEELDAKLRQSNTEYDSKRESERLGPLRLELVPQGFWQQWDRQRLAKTGGTLEQYKHPCLINDLKFRQSVPVLQEIV